MKISYQTHYGNDGTVYNQCITLNNEEKERYNERLQKDYDIIEEKKRNTHVLDNTDMKILNYTKKLKSGLNYLHLTGLWFIEPDKRLKHRNTIVIVK